ncbi:MAG: hypothetical protein JJU41_10455 [Bacteroidetes bacterium]|nr:hypothetical protein [Bacteroidota bacterium]MCH8525055.1 hypothetical protein [Balneolales bacterium]
MNKVKTLYTIHFILIFGVLSGCGYIEGEYEVISDEELEEAGIEVPFPSGWHGTRDEEGNRIVPHDILKNEGYVIEQRYGQIRETVKGDKVFKFSTQLKWIYLFDDYIIMMDGNLGIEDGFFRYFFRPIYSRLNTFDRETFELLDQRVIHGRVRNVIIVDEYVYFHVADYRDKGFYGRYRIK